MLLDFADLFGARETYENDPDRLPAVVDDMLCEAIKWYDHDGEMMTLSEKYPEVCFTLYGEGESNDDIWVTYYKGGKSEIYYAEICYPDPTIF